MTMYLATACQQADVNRRNDLSSFVEGAVIPFVRKLSPKRIAFRV